MNIRIGKANIEFRRTGRCLFLDIHAHHRNLETRLVLMRGIGPWFKFGKPRPHRWNLTLSSLRIRYFGPIGIPRYNGAGLL